MAGSRKSEPPPSDKSPSPRKANQDLLREMEELRARLEEAEETIHAIQTGGVDGLIISGPEGERVFALEGADYPYRVLVEVMNEGIATLDANGIILSCNTRFANFVKLSTEQILGGTLEQFVVRGARPVLRAFLDDPSHEGRDMNANLVRADGTTMPVKLSAGACEVGGLPALCIVVTDMTAFYDMAKTQRWLASIVDTSHDAVISTALDRTILTWNAGAERLFGFSAGEAIGRPISIILPRDRADIAEMADKNAVPAQSIDRCETVRTKSGVAVPVALTISPLKDMQGDTVGASIIARDITERRKAEAELEKHRQHLEEMVQERTKELSAKTEALQTLNEELQAQREELQTINEELKSQSDELSFQREEIATSNRDLQASRAAELARTAELQTVLDTMPAAILISHDAKGCLMHGNHAAEDLMRAPRGANLYSPKRRGMKAGSFLSMRNGVEIPLQDLPVQRAARERVAVQDYEYDLVFWDGSIRHIIGNATPLETGGAVGAFIDITERKRAEEELQKLLSSINEERNRFASLVNSINDEVWFADTDGNFSLVNPSGVREFQLTNMIGVKELAKGLEVYRGDGSPRPVNEAPPLRALAGEMIWCEDEIIRTPGTGELRYRQVNAAPVRDADGSIIGSVAVVRDVTERKRAEALLLESETKYRNLFENMSEEVHFWELVRDADGAIKTWRLVDANPATLKTWARSREDIIGKTTDDIFGPGATDHYMPIVQRIFAEGMPYSFVDYFPNLDKYFRFTSVPLGEFFITTGADISEVKKAEQAILRHNAMLESINAVLNAVLNSNTEEDLGGTCLEIVERVTQSKFGFIGDINEDGLVDIAISNPGWDACVLLDEGGHRIPPAAFKIHGIYGRVIADGKALFTNDPPNHPDSIGIPPGHPPLEAFLGVPLIRDGQTIGIVAVGNREGGYTREHQEILEAIAPAIVEAFLRKRAEDALKYSHDVLEERVAARTRELSRTVEDLCESQMRLAEAQRIAHLGNWEWNIVNDEMIWCDETYRMFGYTPQALSLNAARFLQMVHPDDRELLRKNLAAALQGREDYSLRYRIVLPDGEMRTLSARGVVTFNETGEPVRIFGTVRDITAEVRVQEEAALRQQQLVQADKMVSLGILTAGVAHEINNPNHTIMSSASLLADAWVSIRPILERMYEESGDFVLGGFDYSRGRDEFPKMLEGITQGARRIEAIVSGLRDYSRYNPDDTRSPVEVKPILESACLLLSSMLKKCTDHFTIYCEEDLPKIVANGMRIEQVIVNLLQNACQSLPDRDKGITLSADYAAEKEAVHITVSDEGAGIAVEDLKHLGDPFFTTKRGLGGTGLGLWVSFNIVREHGGTLTFFSVPGAGTRAELTLPASMQE